MPPLTNKIGAWLGHHREKLTDAGLLFLTLNLLGNLSLTPPIPWSGQISLLVIFAALASPRSHLTPGLWPRYVRLLPGYVAAAVVGAILLVWWFALPRSSGWFAPVWLVLTALSRVSLTGPMRRVADYFRTHRLDIVSADVAWVAAFSYAVPRWSQLAAPSVTAVTALLLGWIVWHWLQGGNDPARDRAYRRDALAVIGLALAWGLIWQPASGLWPAIVFTVWLGAGLLLTRLVVARFASTAGTGCAEVLRWLGLVAFIVFLFHPFASANLRGTGDASYYSTFLTDTLVQFRHGVFPVYVGQSEFQFNGSVIPIRVAPGFQYLGGLLDLATGRTLAPQAVQNLLIGLTALAAAVSTYLCLRATTAAAAIAWLLALLFLSCPGVVSLVFVSDLYMSWLTVPWIPVVIYLSCRSFATEQPRIFAGLGFCLGLTWWMHAPIALWLTLVAAGLQLARLVWRRPAWSLLPAQLGWGAAAFLLTAAYPVVSAALYPADPTVSSSGSFVVHAANISEQLKATFPAAWLPVSAFGRQLGDFQLGYGLLAVSILVLPAAWRTGRIELRLLAISAVALLLLLLPIPRLNLWLWELVPGSIRIVTNTWPMQRLYVIIAGSLVLLAGAAWAATRPAAWLHWVLAAACCWSGLESFKFLRGSLAIIGPRDIASTSLRPENVTLTRYSYGMFSRKPAYFTHGVTDPVLENRLLAADLRTVLEGNQPAAIRLAAAGTQTTHQTTVTADAGLLTLQPALTLRPGGHYLAELTASVEFFPATTMVLKGDTFGRVYGLPEYGEARSFGWGGSHVSSFALHTSSDHPETIRVQFIPEDPAELRALDGRLSLRLGEYDPAALPVQIRSWIPYTATVQSAQAAWLETPRMHQKGYIALVNGRPAEVRRSAEGLASVAVPAGRSEVTLRYAAPGGLALSFWVSLGAIAVGVAVALRDGARRLSVRSAANATSAPTGR